MPPFGAAFSAGPTSGPQRLCSRTRRALVAPRDSGRDDPRKAGALRVSIPACSRPLRQILANECGDIADLRGRKRRPKGRHVIPPGTRHRHDLLDRQPTDERRPAPMPALARRSMARHTSGLVEARTVLTIRHAITHRGGCGRGCGRRRRAGHGLLRHHRPHRPIERKHPNPIPSLGIRKNATAGVHNNILLTLALKGSRSRIDTRIRHELPQGLSVTLVERRQPTIGAPYKQQPSRRDDRAAIADLPKLPTPHQPVRRHIQCRQNAAIVHTRLTEHPAHVDLVGLKGLECLARVEVADPVAGAYI